MSRQPISTSDSLCLPFEPEATADSRERNSVLILTAALYAVLAWVSWPSLSFGPSALGDTAWLASMARSAPREAFFHVGAHFWRPGENLWFWAIAHSHMLLPWRTAMLAVYLLTTAYLQYETTLRARSLLDGFGAALAFSLSPATLSVVCWLSAAHIALSAVGLLAYFAFARRALEAGVLRKRYVIAALGALSAALAFYELSLFAPLALLAYQRMLAPRANGRAVRWLLGGSALCALLYMALQLRLAGALSFWAHESLLPLLASSMRYVAWNFYLWFNPFETFGVLIPDVANAPLTDDLLGWLVVAFGVFLIWLFRKSDPLTAWSGVWFAVFLIPVGTFLHFEGTPIAEQHLYIPMLGVSLGAVRLLTRSLEWAIASIRNKPLRVAFEATLSVLLLWSLAPLVAECKRSVEHWSDARELYLVTLQNYPQSSGALSGLAQTLGEGAPPLVAATAPPDSSWQQLLDAFLLRPNPPPAAKLLEDGRALLRAERYEEASSALARAVASSSTQKQQLDSSAALVQALSHTGLREHAGRVLQRLLRDHPTHPALLAIELPAP